MFTKSPTQPEGKRISRDPDGNIYVAEDEQGVLRYVHDDGSYDMLSVAPACSPYTTHAAKLLVQESVGAPTEQEQ